MNDRVKRFFTLKRLAATTVLAVPLGVALGIGGSAAYAAVTSPVHHAAFFACVTNNGAGQVTGAITGYPLSCPSGQILAEDNNVGPQGPAGKDGANGTNGVIASPTTSLVSAAESINTGGSFVTNSTEVGTVSLPAAGTYLLTLNAKVTPNDAAATAQIFPQLFVYDQVKSTSFAGNLFNVGNSPLEPASTNHDSYLSGTSQVTVTSPTTLHVYAFGYDSDAGAGTYNLDNLTVTATQLALAS